MTSLLLTLRKIDIDNVVILLEDKKSIELVYADGYKRGYYPILAGFIVDYKEQVFIISIKANM